MKRKQSGKGRKYTLRKRAEEQAHTRSRIVEAAMQLHGEVGPRATTISAIADRAGVQRLTVYRHFSDESALFAACSSHWLEQNPVPDPRAWSAVADPRERSIAAVGALYRYYRGTEAMWTRVLRDADLPALRAPLAGFDGYLDGVCRDICAAWRRSNGRRSRALETTVRHVVEFSTWRSLAGRHLGDARATALAASWIEAAATA